MRRRTFTLVGALAALSLLAVPAMADHNGAEVDITGGECDPVEFAATVADPEGTHLVENMHLVVDDGADVHVSDPIPTDGTSVAITVGPFDEDTLVMWRVFGGGERDYDDPHWQGYGEEGFTDDINAYADEVGGFAWALSGFADANPFTAWHVLAVDACVTDEPDDPDDPVAPADPDEKDVCKNGGWQEHEFRNQGQCIRFVNTGQDSRI